jgi:hypothetical protein
MAGACTSLAGLPQHKPYSLSDNTQRSTMSEGVHADLPYSGTPCPKIAQNVQPDNTDSAT